MQLVDDAKRAQSREQTLPAPALEATFLDTATSRADELRVVIPAFDDGEHYWPALGWWPGVDDAGEPVYPQAGDEAAVVITEKRRAWVSGWRPAT